jgi:phosphoglycolate phosphatase
MNIFFDLDGTLLDSRKRLYQVFQHLIPESMLTFDDYWALKRNGIGHKVILDKHLNYLGINYLKFEKHWFQIIEAPQWLATDKPFDGITDYLVNVNKKHSINIVTARQSEEMVLNQIDSFGWSMLFDHILVTRQKQEKCDLINNNVPINKSDWIVGDTGKDIQTGKQLGIKSAAVLSGFLSYEKLLNYCPDIIVNSVLEINFDHK